eukprot:4966968-Alexandrium_andersonii.AAC.1
MSSSGPETAARNDLAKPSGMQHRLAAAKLSAMARCCWSVAFGCTRAPSFHGHASNGRTKRIHRFATAHSIV